ncbi:hypothetical protein ACQFX9_22445 [Aliinostoc sp. HNIBRCY26]|uniref:hypothetical protein n=1 Tax=Aliinostoc sp. HNIBRCY26 TaxID=3418997 RepID=UPI003CFC12A1
MSYQTRPYWFLTGKREFKANFDANCRISANIVLNHDEECTKWLKNNAKLPNADYFLYTESQRDGKNNFLLYGLSA